jgi:hypothetical protein
MTDLTKQHRAELRATHASPKHQRLALGARLITARIRGTTKDMKPFAVTCIRMQTFFRGGWTSAT